MAEAHAMELTEGIENLPVMPHIQYPETMDAVHPPLTVPKDLDNDQEKLMDLNDVIFQKGLAMAREIAQATIEHGRRRIERS
jgi:hypothetical protein